MKKCELLSPAGNMEMLKYAIHYGADAIYLAGTRFGARKFANNFTNDELVDVIKYAHLYGVKVYITVNTLIYESEINDVIEYLGFLHKNGVDAVIMQDMGLIKLTRSIYPNLEIHASTQANIHNLEGVKLCEELGIKRVILPKANANEAAIVKELEREKEEEKEKQRQKEKEKQEREKIEIQQRADEKKRQKEYERHLLLSEVARQATLINDQTVLKAVKNDSYNGPIPQRWENGDTYKVAETGAYTIKANTTENAKVGDLFIYDGTAKEWRLVPSGGEDYKDPSLSASNNKIILILLKIFSKKLCFINILPR